MDIGAEISKKIQMAITAKLKELDAYVDDELPDYIMIMVANRKTEAQMTEALSLFLSGNTKTFTSWLHSLLATLRKTKSEKKEDAFHERKSSLGEQEPEEKMEKDSAGNTQKREKVPEHVSNEPIISINPESHDFLDEELQTETVTTAITKSENKTSAPVAVVTENKAPPLKNDIESKVSRLQSKTVTKDTTIEKLSKNKIKLAETKEREQNASQKRVKLSRRETSTPNEKKTESRRHTKSPRSSESHGVKSNPKKVREWDMGKEDGSILKRRQKLVDRYSEISSDSDGEIPEKRKGAVSSAISQVPRDPSFVSDSDDDYPKNKISSKVAYPKRKMRVPLNKQANRALLIRAVSEAEKSVKPRRYSGEEDKESGSSRSKPKRRSRTSSSTDNKRSEKSSQADERLHASREERRQSSMRQSVKLRLGPTPPRKRQLEKSIPVEVVSKVKQEVKLIPEEKPTPVPAKSPKTDPQKKTKIRIKRSTEAEKKTVQPAVVRDQRKFIIQDTGSVKFDQRQMKHHSDAPSEESYEDSTKKKRVTARVTPRLHNPEQQQKQQPRPVTSPLGPSMLQAISPTGPRIMAQAISPTGPRFIVTLDGVVSSKQTVYNNDAVNIKETRAQRFAPAPIIAPTPQALVQPSKTKPPLIFKAQNPVVIPATDVDEDSDIGKHTTNSEMEKMKKKILEVQEEAMKLKKMQAKLASLQAGQLAPSKPTIATTTDTLLPEQRSICVANVHFSTSEKQLSDYFSICGKITRVTILKDVFTGHPKGFAYLEFDDKKAASASLAFDNTSLNNRVIRVTMKQNQPAAAFPMARGRFLTRRSRPRGRGIRAFPYKQNIRRGSLTGATKMVTRNKTWVNPLVAKK